MKIQLAFHHGYAVLIAGDQTPVNRSAGEIELKGCLERIDLVANAVADPVTAAEPRLNVKLDAVLLNEEGNGEGLAVVVAFEAARAKVMVAVAVAGHVVTRARVPVTRVAVTWVTVAGVAVARAVTRVTMAGFTVVLIVILVIVLTLILIIVLIVVFAVLAVIEIFALVTRLAGKAVFVRVARELAGFAFGLSGHHRKTGECHENSE